MDISIDRGSKVPLYAQIVRQIREKIATGALPPGFQLPPERRLAQALGVNRSTVLNAYRELKADALVGAHIGRGTIVLPHSPGISEPPLAEPLHWRRLFRDGAVKNEDPLIRDLLALSVEGDAISLSIGLPAPELIASGEFRDILNELFEEFGARLLLHLPTEGLTALRESLSRWAASRGICCGPSEVMILSGSQQGLDLVARVLLNPGDTVVVEEPTYIGALPVFRESQARLIGVPVDAAGMRTDALASILERHRPKLIYTLPTFQNPSGVVMSIERRRHLLELARRHQVPILEDDPYSELRYEGQAVPSLKALDDGGLVLYLSTFSKVLYPGLRVGYMIAPRLVIRQLALAKQSVDLHSSSPGQWVIDRFIRRGLFEPYLRGLRRAYGVRRDAMEGALRRGVPEGFTWRKPEGGFYYWCRLPDRVERTRLLAGAAEARVTFLPGWSCFHEEPGETYIRLNFSFPSPEDIGQGVERLLAAVGKAQTRPRTGVAVEVGTTPIV